MDLLAQDAHAERMKSADGGPGTGIRAPRLESLRFLCDAFALEGLRLLHAWQLHAVNIRHAGTDLGTVVDVIIETGAAAQIVGYEVAASDALATHGEHVLIPLPDTIAVSGRHLMVPEAALEFVSHDLSGFGAAVEGFRAMLRTRLS